MKDSNSVPSAIAPRLLRLTDAAFYLSSTTWFVEELVRTGKIRSRIIGKRRVIDIRDLDAWIEKQSGSASGNAANSLAGLPDPNAMEILTPEEVAKRLKVSVRWVYEKRRPRAKNPIPCLPLGRYIRFDWNEVLKWLNALADGASPRTQRRQK
jgi:predicted DNA-binding transcriptional regulator AlpA